MVDEEENGEEEGKRESEREKEWSGVGGVYSLRRMGEGAGWPASNEAEARKGAR